MPWTAAPLSLLWPAVLVLTAVSFFISLRVTRSLTLSLLVTTVKAGLFALYYGYWFDGTYGHWDDVIYLEGAGYLHALGEFDLETLRTLAGGEHWLYYLYNLIGIRLFGEHYLAPVTLNVLVSLAIAWGGTRLIQRELAWSVERARLFYVFLALHPDILAWSTLINGKDTLVLGLHLLLLAAGAAALRGRLWSAAAMAATATLFLVPLRFYVPVVFSLAFGLTLIQRRLLLRYAPWVALGVILVAVVLLGLVAGRHPWWQQAEALLGDQSIHPLYGLIRFLLTPIPFGTDPAYRFLDLPALFHWLTFPLAAIGVLVLWRYPNPWARLVLWDLCCFAVLYAFADELQGPRHRVQLDVNLALLQWVGSYALWRSLFRRSYATDPFVPSVTRRVDDGCIPS